MPFLLYTILLFSNARLAENANILIIQPLPYKSHYLAFAPLLRALEKRGHNVTAINSFPTGYKSENYTEIDTSACEQSEVPFQNVEDMYKIGKSVISKISSIPRSISDDDIRLRCSIMQDMLQTSTKFDLVMIQLFYGEAYYGYVHRFRAPFIVLYANWVPYWISDKIGQSDNPSHMQFTYNPWSFHIKGPTFLERLYNAFVYVYYKICMNTFAWHKSQSISYRCCETELDIAQVSRNVSMVFAFSDAVMNGPRPQVPAVVQVGGMHIKEPTNLPQDIEKFINESEHGVVYFCMGSLLRAETLSEEKREAFLKTFAKIPQRVIWKWKGELPGKTEKIFFSEWMPQRDILAHPNVKLFITHGGALGVNEAIYEAVPMLGIPIYGDQRMNVMNMMSHGVAELLDYSEITADTVFEKVQKILTTPRYKRNAQRLSKIYRDRPMSPLDAAVYWTEYVIRHKGAHHLRSPAVELAWYQYLLLDVIGFLVLCLAIITYIIYKGIQQIILRVQAKVRKPVEKRRKKNE